MLNHQAITDLIERRYSCRRYAEAPIPAETQSALTRFMEQNATGPFGSRVRMELIAATDDDRSALKGLGTYGFIRNPTGFIAGAVNERADGSLVDFGWVMEHVVLYATSLDLGTVWLGGTFTKSRFAREIALTGDESMPAVIATGIPAEEVRTWDRILRRTAKSDHRLPWHELFFEASPIAGIAFGKPLKEEDVGRHAQVLEMVRQAPSATNKQPWRVVREGNLWHIYLQRSKGLLGAHKLIPVADLQRIDIGIALCHWELTAGELGLDGTWRVLEPDLKPPDGQTSYIVSWVPGG